MFLFLCSQAENNNYDTYDSFICVAPNEDVARHTSPSEWHSWEDKHLRSWCKTPELVDVELIGVASKSMEVGVVLASFNAG